VEMGIGRSASVMLNHGIKRNQTRSAIAATTQQN
jgi:hypothetical protein